jgi:hypothetical protein
MAEQSRARRPSIRAASCPDDDAATDARDREERRYPVCQAPTAYPPRAAETTSKTQQRKVD